MKYGIAGCLTLLFSLTAAADMVGTFVPVAEEEGFSPPAGYVTHDLVVSTTTDWLAANLVVRLDGGTFYQDALLAGYGPPSPALVSAVPSVRWDTYVMGPGGLSAGAPASAGGAVDLGGSPLATFSDTAIDLNWFTTSATDIGTFSIGRFTLTDDAFGTYELRLDALGQSAPLYLTGTIVNGDFVPVPEASTIILAATGMSLVLLVRKRRNRSQA